MSKPDLNKLIELNKSRNNGVLTCYLCQKSLDETKRMSYVIEHKDNNRKNNDLQNLDIACRQCNYSKNPPMLYKLKGKTLNCEREWERVREKLKVETLAMEKNRVGKPAFEKWLYSEMLKHNKLGLQDVIDSGSFISGVGPDTVSKRWLMPMVSRVAFLKLETETVMLGDKEHRLEFILWRDREGFMKFRYKQLFKKYK